MEYHTTPEVILPDATTSDPDRRPVAVSVVGIGASAGGLGAFKLLLSSLPADTGYAFVFIQHLHPAHPSSLSEILQCVTTMPVTDAQDGIRVEPNHAYTIPPNTELIIADRVLKLSARSTTAAAHLPINRFLRSLAQDCGRQAIGVILSGAGSDGSLGLQAVKEAGGITFAQDPRSAEVPSMPQMAEAATGVDFLLPPAQIAAELARISRHPHFAMTRPTEEWSLLEQGSAGLHEILSIMHDATGIDLSLYREKTLLRRIVRRMTLRNVAGIEEYIAQLRQDAGERNILQKDLFISVTTFFRDPGSFDALHRLAFPGLVQNRPAGATIRIWVPGCATGEEAYSIGISLQEYLQSTGAVFPIQIFASDISEAAIEKARVGKYPDSIAANVSAERLDRHFRKIEGGYQVSPALRDLCIFSLHNLIADPPIAKLDLISCRNVLIYLGGIRKNIMIAFHYALKPDGFLMLGHSESASADDMFQMIDRDHRIYARRETDGRPRTRNWAILAGRSADGGKLRLKAPIAQFPDPEIGKAVDRILLSKYTPATVLVDEALEVLEIRGDAAPFFRLPVGKLSFHLLKLIPDTGLFLEIEKLVQAAAESGETVRVAHVPHGSDGTVREVNIEVTPISDGVRKRALMVILEPTQKFDERAGEAPATASESAETIAIRDRQIARLKQDLEETRERLLSVTEEHQIVDEESQSAVEEGLSANEELQSLNEELETAKEELQSANEDLISVNQELESKNVALTEARNFASSIVETVRVPLLVLDENLRVHAVNRSFLTTFEIPAGRIDGQLLFSPGGGNWDIPGLREVLEGLLPTRKSFENFEVEREFPSIGFKSLIFNGRVMEHLNLILLAIDDVTARKQVERALWSTEQALRQAQKMEAIGRLAGGIAHDFNNLLTAIIGYSRLVTETLVAGHEAIEYVGEIESAGQRAAALTDQLLAFTRRKLLQPTVFEVNTVIGDFVRMLRRIVGESIKVELRLAPDLWRVKADPGEIGRALMNLCLNARDAMPSGGTLTIQTVNAAGPEAEAHLHNLGPGRYVEVGVRDTGTGMDQETQTHIFEPFFTTKEAGKGTGLGLATVLGIVEQSGGAIWCHSELGRGTKFKILLPAVEEAAVPAERPMDRLAEAPKGSAEAVLLVEDEDLVRKLASTILRGRGYDVIEARDGREGVSVSEAYPGKIDLLIADVVMPELGGREMVERILTTRSDTKVLFMSGHTQDVILKEGIKSGIAFLQKPFAPSALARKVREVLDSRGRSQLAEA